MAKTIDESTKEVGQVYRTKEETQQAFRPRISAQAGATVDATNDFESLMGSKANIMRQEHAVSAGIAKRMASDHLMSMNEEIAFINKTMKPGDDRNAAIQRLSSSIASTSGIAAGLTGDAAMEYDKTYIPSARKMATNAMSTWEKEQEDIDKAVLSRDFDNFLNISNNMESDTASTVLAVWKTRLAPYLKNGDADVEVKAATATAKHLVTDATKDPTLNANQRADMLRGKSFMGLAEVTEDGIIKFNTKNQEAKYILSRALAPIMQDAVDETLKISAASTKATLAANKKGIANLGEQNTALRARLKETKDLGEKARIEKVLKRNTAAMGVMEQSDQAISGGIAKNFTDKLSQFESQGSYTAENDSGAYGRYQFMPDTAKEYAAKLGIKYSEWKKPENQDKMFAKFTEDNATSLSKSGIPTTEFNLWGAHNQGVKGFKEILSDKPLSAVRKKKIAANLPSGMEPTKENYIKHWSTKFEGGKVQTGNYSYAPGQSPIDTSKTALNELKNSLAFDSSKEKVTSDSVKTLEGKMTSDKKYMMTKAKESGDYSGVIDYMENSNKMFLKMADKEHFTDTEIKAVLAAQRTSDQAYNQRMFDKGISKLLDAEIGGGATVDQAMGKIIPQFDDMLKGEGYGLIGDSIVNKYNEMVIKENTGQTKPLDAQAVVLLSENIDEKTVVMIEDNIDAIKDPILKNEIMLKADKYVKSEKYQIDLSRNKPIGTYSVDIGRLNGTEKKEYLIREYKKMDNLYGNMSEGDNASKQRFTDLLNGENGFKLDSQVLNHFVANKIVPYTKTPSSFYDAYKINPGVLGHSRVKVSMAEQPGKEGMASRTKYNSFAILSKVAAQQGKEKLFEQDGELLFMTKLSQLTGRKMSDEVAEELESNDALEDFISSWNDSPGVQWQDREEIMMTAQALTLAGNSRMLKAVHGEVLGKYATLNTSTFGEGFAAGELITARTDIAYYSDSTMLAEFKGKSKNDIASIIVQTIASSGIPHSRALEYRDHIMDNGATFTRSEGKVPTGKLDDNGKPLLDYEYYVVLEDDKSPSLKTRFQFTPGKYKTTSLGKVIRNTK